MQELNSNEFTVSVDRFGQIQQMRFEQHAPVILDCRAYTQAGDRWKRPLGQAMHGRHIDAGSRRTATRHTQVQGGKAQGAPQFLPMQDMTAQGVGVAQQILGTRQIADGQRRADLGTRNAMAVAIGHVSQGVYRETGAPAGRAQGVDIAGALDSESKILADEKYLGIQALDQRADEHLWRHAGQRGIERLESDLFDAVAREGIELVAQAGNAGRRQFGALGEFRKIFPRMGLERHDRGGQAGIGGCFAHLGEHGLMAPVDPVEIADGQGAGKALRHGRQAAIDMKRRFHGLEFTILGSPTRIFILPDSNSPPRRLVILISGRGSNMQALVRACEQQGWPATVVAVISSKPEAAGLEWAREQGIAATGLDHRNYDSREAFDEALAESIDQHQPDYVLLAGFMRVLTPSFVKHYAHRLVNIHPSLLPAFPGLHTHAQALATGVRAHGCTVHFVTPVLDHGPIIAQGCVPVLENDTATTLAQRVLEIEHIVYPAAVRWLVSGQVVLDADHQVTVSGNPDRLFFSSSSSRTSPLQP